MLQHLRHCHRQLVLVLVHLKVLRLASVRLCPRLSLRHKALAQVLARQSVPVLVQAKAHLQVFHLRYPRLYLPVLALVIPRLFPRQLARQLARLRVPRQALVLRSVPHSVPR